MTRRDGGAITFARHPRVRRLPAGRETRAALWTAHTLAQTRIEFCAPSGTPPAATPWDEALAPLLELAAPLRTGAQRDALAAYVIRKLHNAWNTRKPTGSRQ